MSISNNNLKGSERDITRIEAFSDGVFAIAITLLVLDIKVPTVETGRTLLQALLEEWPAYFGYLVSFFVVGAIWINHHNLFKYIQRTNQGLLVLNTLFLMVITLIPFPTALLSAYLENPAERHFATLIYSATLTLGSTLFFLLRLYAHKHPRLIDPDLEEAHGRALLFRSFLGLAGYLVSLFISLISVEIALLLYFLIPLGYTLPNLIHRREKLSNLLDTEDQASMQSQLVSESEK